MWQYKHTIQGLNVVYWQSCWPTAVELHRHTAEPWYGQTVWPFLCRYRLSFHLLSAQEYLIVFFLRRTFESKSTEALSLLKPTLVLQVQDVRTSMILPTGAKIRGDNEPWQLLNGNTVWANGQEERSHNALISDNNLHGSSSCTFSQITRRQQVPVSSFILTTTLLEWFHHLSLM